MPGLNFNWGMFSRENNNMRVETLEEIKAREKFVDNYPRSNFRNCVVAGLLGISGLGGLVFGSMFMYRLISGDDRESIKMTYIVGAGCAAVGFYGAAFHETWYHSRIRKKWYKLKGEEDERRNFP